MWWVSIERTSRAATGVGVEAEVVMAPSLAFGRGARVRTAKSDGDGRAGRRPGAASVSGAFRRGQRGVERDLARPRRAHAVAPFLLGAVHRGVGLLEQLPLELGG